MGYTVVLVSHRWRKSDKIVKKGDFEDKEQALQLRNELQTKSDADYRVLGPIKLKKLQKSIEASQKMRRQEGAKKAAKTRKERGASSFVLCPHCEAKSKKLRSEMGGLETRRCQNGHYFEYDRWIADRAFWGPILTGKVPDPYGGPAIKVCEPFDLSPGKKGR